MRPLHLIAIDEIAPLNLLLSLSKFHTIKTNYFQFEYQRDWCKKILNDTDCHCFFRSSVVFVTSWYTLIFIFGLCVLLSQQLVFVSFNLTGDEFRRSSRKKPFWEVLWSHRYNRGFIRNWIEFLFPPNVRSIAEEVV